MTNPVGLNEKDTKLALIVTGCASHSTYTAKTQSDTAAAHQARCE
ncbi:conserved protein of unknown function [Pseudomonas marincola]|uniref:Uncharacterized protein n=1 Tax=Pseudomonas marincola TaxID=437900 RepID=A0A653E7F8_9PSED|nr:conserved protein of unknown function [Pseudomonas marincola]